MNKHPKKDRTLVVLKPDAVQRSLVGEIIKRLERVGLKLIAVKMFVPTLDFVEKHYTFDPSWKRKAGEKSIKGFLDKGITPKTDNPLEMGEMILDRLKVYLTSGPVIAMIWEGAHAIPLVRKLVGSTEPFSSDVGTIRGDYVLDSYEMSAGDDRSIRNLIHASGNEEDAELEIPHWFNEDEIIEYRSAQEGILYE